MILYHGSNIKIDVIDFNKSRVGKDFGVGFYLTPELEQAQEMAEKKARSCLMDFGCITSEYVYRM